MQFVYGLANGKSVPARRIYAERYHNGVIPHHIMFGCLHQRLTEAGSFKKFTTENKRHRTVATPPMEEVLKP